ncbi:MAG: type II secretion system protein GspG [Verrucomicrobiota bacterium]|nr:type II secretion system protein GspG [Verrucomicrobiota bacterium]
MNNQKFTLIEILIVVVISLILAGLVAGTASFATRVMREGVAKGDIARLEVILKQYESDWGYYPQQGRVPGKTSAWSWEQQSTNFSRTDGQPQVFDAIFRITEIGRVNFDADNCFLSTDQKVFMEDYTKFDRNVSGGTEGGFRDPWENFYFYQSPGVMNVNKYDLWSVGNDRIPGDPTGLDQTEMHPLDLTDMPEDGDTGSDFTPADSQVSKDDPTLFQPEIIDDLTNWDIR